MKKLSVIPKYTHNVNSVKKAKKGFLLGDIGEVVTLIGEEETDFGMLITLFGGDTN